MTHYNDRMEPVKIASGRWVAFGHVVENFGVKAVVMGKHPEADLLVLKEILSPTKTAPGSWLAKPELCK